MSNKEKEVTVIEESLPVVQVSESAALMTVIERMATMPDLDMDRVERMFGMHEKLLDRQSEKEFNDAMARTQMAMENVMANMRNEHTGKNFANLSAIHAKCKPVWTSNGLSVNSFPSKSEQDHFINITTVVRHAGGHKEQISFDYPLDTVGSGGKVNKTMIQGMGSSMEYGRRYQEMLFFDIAIEGKDDDGGVLGEPISAELAAEIKAELQSTNSNVKGFLKFVGAKDVDSMTEKQAEKGQKMLANKAKKNAN